MSDNMWIELERTRKRFMEAQAEILALRERLAQAEREVSGWREAARYDPTVPAPSFRAWNRSQLDRCRRRYIEAALAPKPKEPTDG